MKKVHFTIIMLTITFLIFSTAYAEDIKMVKGQTIVIPAEFSDYSYETEDGEYEQFSTSRLIITNMSFTGYTLQLVSVNLYDYEGNLIKQFVGPNAPITLNNSLRTVSFYIGKETMGGELPFELWEKLTALVQWRGVYGNKPWAIIPPIVRTQMGIVHPEGDGVKIQAAWSSEGTVRFEEK